MNSFKKILISFGDIIEKEINYVSIKPTKALLFITYRCTSQCKMCTIWKYGKKVDVQKELSLEDWKKCVDMLGPKNLKFIEIFGGDALLRKNVTIPLIKYIKNCNENIIVEFPTNCNLIDEETALALVKVGVDRLYISLDGLIDIHDKIRGKSGTYSNVKKAIEYFVKAKTYLKSKTPEIIINCTISSNNVDNFESIIPIVRDLGADIVDLEYVGEFREDNIQNTILDGVKPTPFYVNLSSSNLLCIEEAYLLKKKMKKIRDLSKKFKIKIVTSVIDTLTIDNLINGTIPNKKCYICRNWVTIDPFGNVMGCFHYNNFIYGNIKDVPFKSIWKNNKHLSFIEAQKKGKIKICQNCVSGVNRNATFDQTIYRLAYFNIKGKGFDE